MMTDAELQILTNTAYCVAEKTTQGGVSGYLIKGVTEGYKDKSIFLPSAGYGNANSINSTPAKPPRLCLQQYGHAGSFWQFDR